VALTLIDDSPDAAEELGAAGLVENGLTVFGGKTGCDRKLRCGLIWGDSTLVNPFGVGLVVFVIFIRRLKPTAIHGVALRATATNTIPVRLALMRARALN
jgi:hypothetical protein